MELPLPLPGEGLLLFKVIGSLWDGNKYAAIHLANYIALGANINEPSPTDGGHTATWQAIVSQARRKTSYYFFAQVQLTNEWRFAWDTVIKHGSTITEETAESGQNVEAYMKSRFRLAKISDFLATRKSSYYELLPFFPFWCLC